MKVASDPIRVAADAAPQAAMVGDDPRVTSALLTGTVAAIAAALDPAQSDEVLASAVRAVAAGATGSNAHEVQAWVARRDTKALALVAQRALGIDDLITLMQKRFMRAESCRLEMGRDGAAPRLLLPDGVADLFEHIAAHRKVMLAAGTTDPTETVRGCPVAGRGPITDADGTTRMSERAGLTVLVEAFAGIVDRVLDAQAARA